MATKKTSLTREKIISMYMDYTLENNSKPTNAHLFAKANGFTEAEFYTFFGAFELLEKEIFKLFFTNTLEMLQKNEEYTDYDMKTKMLSFYFTFFEIVTANRSYVLMALKQEKNKMKNLAILKDLRAQFKAYVSDIITFDFIISVDAIQGAQEKIITESLWVQFILTLKFWLDDTSVNFEKTDIFIEKSNKVFFDLLQTIPINGLIDFGKFIFKEKIHKK